MEIVNPVPVEEMAGWTANVLTTFLRVPDPAVIEDRAALWRDRLADTDRVWGARDHGRWVATLATETRRLTVPGPHGTTNDIAIDALTAVTVNATHRRRGLLSSMLTASLAAARERGDAVAYLVAAEWPIYGRYGYGPAVLETRHVYHPRARGAGIEADPAGAVRQVEVAEVLAHAPAVFDAARRLRAGEIDRSQRFWAAALGVGQEKFEDHRNWYLHEGPDGPDGYLSWTPTKTLGAEDELGAVTVNGLSAATPLAYRNLWAYLSGIDVVDRIDLTLRPVDEPARFLMADGRALRLEYAGDLAWLAVLDVPAALTARGYRGTDRLVLDVVDTSAGGYATGRWALDASPDGATCVATTESADLVLPSTALGSTYLGGYSLRALAAAGRIDEVTDGAVERFDALFGTALAPWLATGF